MNRFNVSLILLLSVFYLYQPEPALTKDITTVPKSSTPVASATSSGSTTLTKNVLKYAIVLFLIKKELGLYVPALLILFSNLFSYSSLLKCGKSRISRMECLSVSSMVRRSMPMPKPPLGGMP